MKILVTGGLGFIGSHVVERLHARGHDVCVLDHQRAEDFNCMTGDIRILDDCMKACNDVEVVIHTAGMASIDQAGKNPLESAEINLMGTLHLLQASCMNRVRRFIFLSSAKVYGEDGPTPSSELDMPIPATPYAMTKYASEFYCRHFSEKYDMEAIVLRPFSVFGPGQDMRIGYIGNIIQSVAHDQKPVLPGDALLSRDYTYIDDAAEAIVRAALTPRIRWDVFNIGSGQAQTLSCVMLLVNSIFEKNIQPLYTPMCEGVSYKTLADMTHAHDILGFEPTVSFEEGLRKTVAWYLGSTANLGAYSL
jgi:UDP-N-acetylglucosamine/UDP-N-acetylgalactosamine 4-epimerase